MSLDTPIGALTVWQVFVFFSIYHLTAAAMKVLFSVWKARHGTN